MTAHVLQVLKEFEQLSDAEKQDAAAEILRRTRDWEYPSLTDEEMDRVADELFQQYDKEEAGDA